MKKEKQKHIFMFTIEILVFIAIIISSLVINDKKQIELLKQEINNVTSKELTKDNYDLKLKTTGDYAYIEEAVKKYFKELSDNIKIINSYLTDEQLIHILTAKNLETDGPNFDNSYKIITNTRENTNKSIQKIASLCTEDTIKNLINKEKVNKKTYELYLELMYTKKDLEELTKTKTEIETVNNDLNTFLDKVKVMLDMLKENQDNWYIDKEQLYFETSSLVNKYNSLHKDLNDFVTEKFSKYKNNTNENTNNNV